MHVIIFFLVLETTIIFLVKWGHGIAHYYKHFDVSLYQHYPKSECVLLRFSMMISNDWNQRSHESEWKAII